MKKMIITGNVAKDPEVRSDNAGNSYVTFAVGITVGTKAAPKTDWVDVSCNGKVGDIVSNYVKKGTKVLVEGFPATNAYINKENKPAASLRIYASIVELLSKHEDTQEKDYDLSQHGNVKNIHDDIPF